MDVPDEFYVESDSGMFQMSKVRTSMGRTSYFGMANGLTLTLHIGSGNSYRAVLSSEREVSGRLEFRSKGSSPIFDTMKYDIARWVDSVIWDSVAEPGPNDTHYAVTSRGRIAYYSYNTHIDAIPVLFLHGGPGDGAGTTKMRTLHLRHPVYTYDQMGCGQSDAIDDLGMWNHEDYFDELNEFIGIMGFEKVIIIGASWGAGLAVGYVAKYGCERIHSMVLPSPFLSSKRWMEDQLVNLRTLPDDYQREMEDFMAGKGTMDNYHHVMSEYYSRFLFTRGCNREIAQAAGMGEQNEVFKAMWGSNDFVCAGTMKDMNLIPSLSKITVPVLLMCGDSDEVTVETMMEYHRAIEGSRLSIVPYAGHVLSMEQPESYAAAVRGFLMELGQ